jgi:hypothetical protein
VFVGTKAIRDIIMTRHQNSEYLCDSCNAIFNGQGSMHPAAPAFIDPWCGETKAGSGDKPYIGRGVHHARASDCKTSSDNGCPICYFAWARASSHWEHESKVLQLDLKGRAFSSWILKLNGSDLYAQENWPADRLVLVIYVGSVSFAGGLGVLDAWANGIVTFGLEPVEGMSITKYICSVMAKRKANPRMAFAQTMATWQITRSRLL